MAADPAVSHQGQEPLDLEPLKARVEGAFTGPWQRVYGGGGLYDVMAKSGGATVVSQLHICDAAFIAHARQDIPALIAEIERLRALASASASPQAKGEDWQPIETAPKDGTNVLLWWPFWVKARPTIGWFGYKGIQQWVAPEALEGDGDPPTHWQPLPQPPSARPASLEEKIP